jgi:hypothetical protein
MASQVETLQTILQRIDEEVKAGVSIPIVEIDLDLAALMPVVRTRRALEVASKKIGLRELANAGSILPGYSDEAWIAFLTMYSFPLRYPDMQWLTSDGKPAKNPGTPFRHFHEAYWTADLLIEDEPVPGLCTWVERVEAHGGRVVFVSGRWLPEHIGPSIECLRRAGIPRPALIIGNDQHETLVGRDKALSDAAIKANRQAEIRVRFGEPVAFVDDRPANRTAVAQTLGSSLLPVAITIPHFTCDPENDVAEWRISTFELFTDVLGDPPRHEYLLNRYGPVGNGKAWLGMYEGLGANDRPYAVRRCITNEDLAGNEHLLTIKPPYSTALKREGPVPEHDFLHVCEETVPREILAAIDRVLDEASRLADCGLAAPFASSTDEYASLRRSLVASWLHSRDIETVMVALGFPLVATGVHDVHELAPADEIRKRILHSNSAQYSSWLLAWVEQMPSDDQADVGCFNPALSAGMWRWHPNGCKEDAMDVHRLSSHHEGDRAERYDPLEAAVNNLLHRREGTCGIRKEPVEIWSRLTEQFMLPSNVFALAKTGVAIGLYRDLIRLGPQLERNGYITPWYIVSGES